MIGKGPLWKNIGKEGSSKSPESSLSSGGRPVKAFHIMFEEDLGSRSEMESEARRNRPSEQLLKRSSSIREELDGSPMIITDDVCDRGPHNEEVLEVISFDSHENERVLNMDHVLKSMTQISEKAKQAVEDQQSRSIQQHFFPNRLRHSLEKLGSMGGSIQQLRQELHSYRFYLLSVLSEWEVQAINNFKAMKDRIDACLAAASECRPKEDGRFAALQQEVAMLTRSLALERQAREVQRRQNSELEEKLRRLERGQNQARHRMGSDQAQAQQLRTKNKKLQLQLSEAKLEAETQIVKVAKLKEVMKEREGSMTSLNEEMAQLQRRIKQLKFAMEECSSRERKQQMEAKSLRERLEREKQAWQKELTRGKLEQSKLKGLLKVSEEQLSQCEDYINKLNCQIKELHSEASKMQEKLRSNELQYFKKLQECDQYLIELENNIKELTTAQQRRQEQYELKESELSRLNEECRNKAIELKAKEGEIEELKKEYEHKLMNLSRREDGMKAEYRMAIDVQHAAKEKWYQRYYTMFSPERQRNEQVMSPHRDFNPQTGRSSFTRKETEPREARSPIRDRLFKAKSERNLNLNLNLRNETAPLTSPRNEFERCQSQKDLVNLGSRINTLRRELTRELGQIGLKS